MTKLFAATLPLLILNTIACGSEVAAMPPNAAGTGGTAGASPAGGGGGTSGVIPSAGAGSGGQTSGGATPQGGVGGVAGGSGGAAGALSAGGFGGGGAASVGGGGGGGAGAGGGMALPPLEECTSKASIDRLTEWNASGEGQTVPATGSIVVEQGGGHVAKVHFVGSEWHVIPVLVANQFGVSADLSGSQGITLTYSATSALHVQLRSKSHWSGGNQYATDIPATDGKQQTIFLSFAPAGWQSLFGAPTLSYADTLKEVMGMVFVGNSENDVVFHGLRIDGFTPKCP